MCGHTRAGRRAWVQAALARGLQPHALRARGCPRRRGDTGAWGMGSKGEKKEDGGKKGGMEEK